MDLENIILAPETNYIGAFLTLRCNFNCDYCLNKQGQIAITQEMSAEDWIQGLSRLQTRIDLPITLQGGEPTFHQGFYQIVFGVHKHLDLLTNGAFNTYEFMTNVPNYKFQRKAKYASIRFSFHDDVKPITLIMKVWELQNRGYEVGVWGFSNNKERNKRMAKMCKFLNIDFRVKEYLTHSHGTYKYPEAISGKGDDSIVKCRTHELLIGPSGHIYKCHSDLYANKNWIGHILDPEFTWFEPTYRNCTDFGECNPCDIKMKTNRLQEDGYCSVEIKKGGLE